VESPRGVECVRHTEGDTVEGGSSAKDWSAEGLGNCGRGLIERSDYLSRGPQV